VEDLCQAAQPRGGSAVLAHVTFSVRSSGCLGTRLKALIALCPLALALLVAPAPAGAARTPTQAAANTVVDGPSAAIASLDDMSVARDGTGGLVYLKDVQGVAHVFVSELAGGRFQAPAQVDAGLVSASSQPVIAAGQDGMLLIAFINDGQLYVSETPAGGTVPGPPAALFDGAAGPSLSMSNFGKAYLAFTAIGGGGGADVRAAYYNQGQWALESAPLDADPADAAGTGAGRPQVATAGDGVAIVAWGEGGHIYTRRLTGTAPSAVDEQADVPTLSGWLEVSAGDPVIATGGDSSYAAVAFRETFSSGSGRQSRVLSNRLHGSQYDGIGQPDGMAMGGPEGADQPQVSVTEYGAGFITSEGDQAHELLATTLGGNEVLGSTLRVDSLPNSSTADAVPATAGLVSTLIAWQQEPGIAGPAEIRVRYSPGGSDLNPEQVVSSATLGAADADRGLFAAGDVSGDAVIAWVQGTGAGTQIVAAQLYDPPGGFVPSYAFRYLTVSDPLLTWTGAPELWGSPQYVVRVDGVQIGATAATQLTPPAPLADGRHSWQVTAVNQVGLSTPAAGARVFVDTVPPRVSLKVTGKLIVHSYLHLAVTDTDARPPLPRADASGVASVVAGFGDGSRYTITHGKYHAYMRPGRYTVTVTVTDRAGNRTTITRTLQIKPKPKPKKKKKKHRKAPPTHHLRR
jgi:hypothetical protein